MKTLIIIASIVMAWSSNPSVSDDYSSVSSNVEVCASRTVSAELTDSSSGDKLFLYDSGKCVIRSANGSNRHSGTYNINGTKISTGAELSTYMDANPLTDSAVLITYERKSEDGTRDSITVEITPVLYQEVYSVGFSYNLSREKVNVLQTLKYSFVEVKYWIVTTIKNLGLLVTGQLSSNDVGGPVAIIGTIGDVYEQTQEVGTALDVVLQMAYITILLSANLGVMNLLPIPALDGGKLVFTLIEAVRGKPIDREKEGMVHLIGMVLLMVLMVFIFFNDIKNIFVK